MNLKTHFDKAFSLLEVMIAVAIFFMALFAILEMTSQSLRAAGGLKQSNIHAGSVAAEVFVMPEVVPGSDSGDFGYRFPNASWTRSIEELTNGLFQVDVTVNTITQSGMAQSTLSVLVYRPEFSTMAGSAGGGRTFGRRGSSFRR